MANHDGHKHDILAGGKNTNKGGIAENVVNLSMTDDQIVYQAIFQMKGLNDNNNATHHIEFVHWGHTAKGEKDYELVVPYKGYNVEFTRVPGGKWRRTKIERVRA